MGDLKSHGNRHPKDTPLEEWPDGWLVMEVASLMDEPGYIMMNELERKKVGWPDSPSARRDFIAAPRA
jgi:hypothetical protein